MLVNRGLLSQRVLIEPKWNLKHALHRGYGQKRPCINRTKVEFKEIRFNFKLSVCFSINRTKVEFKAC